MTWVKLVLLLLQITQSIIRMVNEKRLISEGERLQIVKELSAVASAAAVSKQVRDDVGRKTDAEIDDALRGDYRD